MADHKLLEELRRELPELITAAERLAGRLRAMETVVERYGGDEG
jgi:hypothetical protein